MNVYGLGFIVAWDDLGRECCFGVSYGLSGCSLFAVYKHRLERLGCGFGPRGVLGGSWVVISMVISPLIWVIPYL